MSHWTTLSRRCIRRCPPRTVLWGLVVLGLALAPPAVSQDGATQGGTANDAGRVEQLERELEQIREEMKALRAELDRQAEAAQQTAPAEVGDSSAVAEDRFTRIERQIEILAQEIERQKIGDSVFRPAEKSEHGLGVAASKVYQVEQGLSIGGYGEALFEAFDSTRDDGSPSGKRNQSDFLRAILYFGYKFDDRWVFNSEIEFEHASTGAEGEASVEFAYLDYLWRPEINLRAGLVLVPMGFVNELHEPPLFLGTRRPQIEQAILPTTWRENGFGIFGDVGDFSYRTYLVNGLDGSGFSAGGLRGGRQKGSKAVTEDVAWVGRLDYTGTPGVLAGVSAYIGDSGQGLSDARGAIDVGTQIVEAHVEYEARGFELRFLGVRAEVDDAARLNDALGLSGAGSVGDELEGWYLELGYDLLARGGRGGGQQALVPFARWETYDTQSSVPAGFAIDPGRDVDVLTLGLHYRPLDPLVFKIDLQDFDNGAGTGVDQINAAIGYIF